MRLGILSKVHARPTLESVMDAIAKVGLECIQFNFESAGLPPMPDKIPAGLAARTRRVAGGRLRWVSAKQARPVMRRYKAKTIALTPLEHIRRHAFSGFYYPSTAKGYPF